MVKMMMVVMEAKQGSSLKLLRTWQITKYVQSQAIGGTLTRFIYVEMPSVYGGHDI